MMRFVNALAPLINQDQNNKRDTFFFNRCNNYTSSDMHTRKVDHRIQNKYDANSSYSDIVL